MKSTLIRVLALMTCVMLLLTGCNLIAIDEEMQAAEDAAAREEDYSTLIVEFADGTGITKGEMINTYNDTYSYYAYLYSIYYGEIPSDLPDYVKQQTASAYLAQEVIIRHADEYGVTMTEEMEEEAAADAQNEWDEYVASYMESNPAEDGVDEETARAEAIETINELGYTYEYMLAEHRDTVLVNAIIEAMCADITEPSEEDVAALYEEKVAADEETYSADTAAYEDAISYGDTIYWAPEGYRTVQHILLKPTTESLLDDYSTAYDNLMDLQNELLDITSNGVTDEARTADVVTAEVNAANAALKDVEAQIQAECQDTIDEIMAKLDEGASFPELINDYTADSDAELYVSASTTSLISPFQIGAMALEKVGDVSEPIVGQHGVHLIYYASDVPAGAVALDDVRDSLTEEALNNAKDARYEELVNQWSEEAGAKVYIERWVDETEE